MQKSILFLMILALFLATPASAVNLGDLADTLKDDKIAVDPKADPKAQCRAVMERIKRDSEGKIFYFRKPVYECPERGTYTIDKTGDEVTVACSVHGPLADADSPLDALRCKLAMRKAAEAKKRQILGFGPIHLAGCKGVQKEADAAAKEGDEKSADESAAGDEKNAGNDKCGIMMPVNRCPEGGGIYKIQVLYYKNLLKGIKKGTDEATLASGGAETAAADEGNEKKDEATATIGKLKRLPVQRGVIVVTCPKHGTCKLPFVKKPAFDPANFRCGLNKSLIKRAVERYLAEKKTAQGLAVDLKTLVSEGYLKAEPVCPSAGNYSIKVSAMPDILCKNPLGDKTTEVGIDKCIRPPQHRVTVTCSKHPALSIQPKPFPWKPKPMPFPFPKTPDFEKKPLDVKL